MSDVFDRVAAIVADAGSAAGRKATVRKGVAVSDTDVDGHVQVQIGAQIWQVTDYTGRVKVGDQVTVIEQANTAQIGDNLREVGALEVPIGGVILWLSNTIPAGWRKLDGTTFDAAANPVVYGLLGSNTLPTAADRFPIGVSATRAVRAAGGSEYISEGQLPAHSHSTVEVTAATFTASAGATFYGVTNGVGETGETGTGDPYWPRYLAMHLIMRMG